MGLTDYLSIVKYPMDLATLQRKMKGDHYTRVEEVLDDIQLIWDNCKAYNPDSSWIHSVAEKLERAFKKMVRNYFPDLNVSLPNSISLFTKNRSKSRKETVRRVSLMKWKISHTSKN